MSKPLEAVSTAMAALEEVTTIAVAEEVPWKVRRELLEAAAHMIKAKALLLRDLA
jgi:hypothetical protein